ncbi:MAG: hypothetical protein ACI3ZY_09670 [Parabacteroides sp.]
MNNFLSLLKQNRSLGIPLRETALSEFFFRIATDKTGRYVETVDRKRSPVFPDYRSYTGEVSQTLRLFGRLRDACLLRVNWDRGSAGERVYLADSPYLMWQLARCSNLVNEAMSPVGRANGIALPGVAQGEGMDCAATVYRRRGKPIGCPSALIDR